MFHTDRGAAMESDIKVRVSSLSDVHAAHGDVPSVSTQSDDPPDRIDKGQGFSRVVPVGSCQADGKQRRASDAIEYGRRFFKKLLMSPAELNSAITVSSQSSAQQRQRHAFASTLA
jgi:hypothetical protein